jgi:hypothetical protein
VTERKKKTVATNISVCKDLWNEKLPSEQNGLIQGNSNEHPGMPEYANVHDHINNL